MSSTNDIKSESDGAASNITSTKTRASTTKNTLEEDQEIVRSMWETPSIYQYLSFFKQPLGLKSVSCDDLENLLLNPKNYSKLIADIFIALIRELLPVTKQRTVNYNNWEHFLKVELNKENNYFDCFEENPFQEDELFSSIELKNRVLLLKSVCDWNLSKSNTTLNHVKQFIAEPDTLRNLPMGILNNEKEFYWYFGDYRLYKETLNGSQTYYNRKKRDNKGNKEQNGKWEIICSTQEEWEELIQKYEPYNEDKEESDEKTLYINLKDVLPQVLTKLSSSKRKKNIFSTPSSTSITEPKQWRSTRLLALDLRKREQEDLMQIQQQQFQQLENDPFSRPRSTRNRTNLYYSDDGVLTFKVNSQDEDMIGGGKSSDQKKRRRDNDNGLNVQVHYSRSGRRVITDDSGRPKAYNTLSEEEKKYVDKIFSEEDNNGEVNPQEEEEEEEEEEEDNNKEDNKDNNSNSNHNSNGISNNNDGKNTKTTATNKDEKEKLQNELQQLQQQLQKEQQNQTNSIQPIKQQQESMASNSTQVLKEEKPKDNLERMDIDISNNSNNSNSNNNINNLNNNSTLTTNDNNNINT